jgi:hypothetical protein
MTSSMAASIGLGNRIASCSIASSPSGGRPLGRLRFLVDFLAVIVSRIAYPDAYLMHHDKMMDLRELEALHPASGRAISLASPAFSDTASGPRLLPWAANGTAVVSMVAGGEWLLASRYFNP